MGSSAQGNKIGNERADALVIEGARRSITHSRSCDLPLKKIKLNLWMSIEV